jgi:hypothetical protein
MAAVIDDTRIENMFEAISSKEYIANDSHAFTKIFIRPQIS